METTTKTKCKYGNKDCPFYDAGICNNMTAYRHCSKTGIEWPKETIPMDARAMVRDDERQNPQIDIPQSDDVVRQYPLIMETTTKQLYHTKTYSGINDKDIRSMFMFILGYMKDGRNEEFSEALAGALEHIGRADRIPR